MYTAVFTIQPKPAQYVGRNVGFFELGGTVKKGKHPEKALTAMKVNRTSEPGRYADGNGLYLVVDENRSQWSPQSLLSRTTFHHFLSRCAAFTTPTDLAGSSCFTAFPLSALLLGSCLAAWIQHRHRTASETRSRMRKALVWWPASTILPLSLKRAPWAKLPVRNPFELNVGGMVAYWSRQA